MLEFCEVISVYSARNTSAEKKNSISGKKNKKQADIQVSVYRQ